MERVRARHLDGVDPVVVAGYLDRRPGRWLRPFLQLAARRAAPAAASQPRFRVSSRTEGPGVRLTWVPQVGPPLFDRFSGEIIVETTEPPGGARIAVVGSTTGGSEPVDVLLLDTLIDLLAAEVTDPGDDPTGSRHDR